MEELWRRLETYVSGWFPPKGALNMQRCVILEQCMSAGAQYGPGLFTLTVPTGGGKTVASLSFAPVSYTHLDVYKRQELASAASISTPERL